MADGISVPENFLLFGSKELLSKGIAKFKAKKVKEWRHKNFPVYEFSEKGSRYGLSSYFYGASAAAASLEDLIEAGAKNILFVSYARPIDEEVKVGSIILPSRAVRDEGTSFHYLQPAKHVYGNIDVEKSLKQVFKSQSLKARIGMTWTTDAPYSKVRKTKELLSSGAMVIDNETSALLAVARYRKVFLGGTLIVDEPSIRGRIKHRVSDPLKDLKNHVIGASFLVLSKKSFWKSLADEASKPKPKKQAKPAVPKWDDRIIALANSVDSEAESADLKNEENQKILESVLTEAEFFIAQYNRTRSKFVRRKISNKTYNSVSEACIEVLEKDLEKIRELKSARADVSIGSADHDEIAEQIFSQLGGEEHEIGLDDMEKEPVLQKPHKSKLSVWLVNLPRRFRYKPYYKKFFEEPVDPDKVDYRQFVGKVE